MLNVIKLFKKLMWLTQSEGALELIDQDVDVKILQALGLKVNDLKIDDWRKMVETYISPENGLVELAVVGKYVSLADAYKSINEALIHAGIAHSAKVKLRHIEAEKINKDNVDELLSGVSGIYGSRRFRSPWNSRKN